MWGPAAPGALWHPALPSRAAAVARSPLREDAVDRADPLTLLLPLLRRRPQHHTLLEGLARLYRHLGEERRAALRDALPGIAEEAALWRALRAPERRN